MAMAVAEKSMAKLNLQPLDNRVVIERDEAEDTTTGGIVLPDKAREKVDRGRVLAVGPGKLSKEGERIGMTVEVGNHVLMGKYGGDDLEIDDRKVVIVKEDDILAVLDD